MARILVIFFVICGTASAMPPVPPVVVTHREQCPYHPPDAASGCATAGGDIWVRPGAGPWVYWHEVGHVFDFQVMTDEQREGFRQLVGAAPRGWWEGPYHAQLGERFARTYANCAMRALGRRWRVNATACSYIWQIGGQTYEPPSLRRGKGNV